MATVYYRHGLPVRHKTKKTKRKFVLLVILSAFIGSLAFLNLKPIVIAPQVRNIEVKSSSAPNINWSGYKQAAIGALDQGVLASSPNQQKAPIASITKVMTALTVLKKQPLKLEEGGPIFTISPRDVQIYEDYLFKDGSIVKVNNGEKYSQLQVLQAMLIPSANNMADSLVIWMFGSMENYIKYSNDYAQELGLKDSYFADASGFSPKSASTAKDLILLGELALKNEVIAKIVSTEELVLPNIGRVVNTNRFLDYNGNQVVGIKTGNTDEAGGTFLTAAKYNVDGQDLVVIVAVMGASESFEAQQRSMVLLATARDLFDSVLIASKNEEIALYVFNRQKLRAVLNEDIKKLVWPGQDVSIYNNINELRLPVKNNTKAGTMTVKVGNTTTKYEVLTDGLIQKPKWYMFWAFI